jgi:UPF0716 protein FxsA
MFTKIVVALLAIWAVGISCLLLLAKYVSWEAAIIECLVTGAVGFSVLVYVGIRFGNQFELRYPGSHQRCLANANTITLVVASGLLILPGMVSDAVGLLLLFPPVRRVVAARARQRYLNFIANLEDG